MYTRIISLILVAAVLGCPLWCSMGFCQCSPNTIAGARSIAGALSGDTDNCCQPPCCAGATRTAQESHSPNGRGPHPEPDSHRCQGICGGAVLQGPCQVSASELCQFLPALKRVHYCLQVTQQRKIRASRLPNDNAPANRGRSVRICYMSFQC